MKFRCLLFVTVLVALQREKSKEENENDEQK